MFNLGLTKSTPPPHQGNNTTPVTHLCQDEDDDQFSGVYRAKPVVDNSTSIQSSATIKVNLDEGEDRDTFVLVPGLLCYNTIDINLPGGNRWTVADYWSDVKGVIEDPFISSPSSLGSLHDRAVELYYQIKGGQVDYGLKHSYQFCHNQLGATYEGFMPHWDHDNPIVLIGKGYGATTALYLQHLLSTNFFGQHTSGRMVKAIICLSAPHRGSTLPYWLGLEAGSKCVVNPFSLLQLFLSFVHIVCYFACLDRLFPFQLNDKWNLSSSKEGGEQSIWSAISTRSRFAYFGDNFLADWSVEGARMKYAEDGEDKHYLEPDCAYINYITTGSSWRSKVTGHYWPRLTWRNLPTCIISIILGQYRMTSKVERHVLRTSSSTFWENDGILSVYSQQPPPHQRVQMNIVLTDELFDPIDHELTPGAWYNVYVEDRSHTALFVDDDPFLATLPLIKSMLEMNAVKRFGKSLAKNTANFEHYYIHLVEFFERRLCYLGSRLTGNGATNIDVITTDRIEERTGDKAGVEWCNRVSTTAIAHSPTRMFTFINEVQKIHESGVIGSRDLTTLKENLAKNNFIGTAPLIPSGPTIVKARHKMTTEDHNNDNKNNNNRFFNFL